MQPPPTFKMDPTC